jgi:hypothetical protein
MAAYVVNLGEIGAYEKTLVAATPDTVIFSRFLDSGVEITSDGSAAIYVTLDGTTASVAGGKMLLIPAGTGPVVRRFRFGDRREKGSVVGLVSSGTPKYSVAEVRDSG